MNSRLMPISWLLVGLIFLHRTDAGDIAGSNEPLVPAPWGLKTNEFSGDESFYIKSEVHLIRSGKSFLFEEWAVKSTRSYKLNLIDKSIGKLGTLLNNAPDKERVYYEPYKCQTVEDLKDVIDPLLTSKFPANDSWIIAGAGSLWYYASNLKPSEFKQAAIDDKMIIGKITTSKFMKTLDMYTFESTEAFPYELVFLFRQPDGNMTNGGVADPKDLVAIRVQGQEDSTAPSDVDNRGSKVLLHIRILEMRAPLSVTYSENYNLFELPLGYGCEKQIKYRYTSPIDLQLLPSLPQMLEMDVVVNQLTSGLSFSNAWKSHSASLRITGGQLNFNDGINHRFISYETAFHSLDRDSENLEVGRYTLQRVKRIWDLKADQKTSEGIYYELDARANSCREIGSGNIDITSNFIIPIEPKLFSLDDNSTLLVGLPLSPNQLIELFSNTKDFHLLREISPTWSSREQTFEKKIEAFALLDTQSGQPIVTAPASLIRKHTLLDVDIKNPRVSRQSGKNVETNIYLFSQDRDKLLMKIKMTLIERELINDSYFHHGLNISPCLESSPSPYSAPGSTGNTFKVNYPLDAPDINNKCAEERPFRQSDKLDFDDSLESQAYEKFLLGLFEASAGRLNPLQLADMKVEVVEAKTDNLMVVTGRLLDFPHLSEFKRTKGYKFSLSGKESSMVTEIAANERSCAESCKNYNCLLFSYCEGSSKTCYLELKVLTFDDQPTFIEDPDCSTYTMVDLMVKRKQQQVSAGELLRTVKQRLSSDSPEDQKPLDVALDLPGGSVITLKASSIETNVESMSKFDDMAVDLLDELLTSKKIQIESDDTSDEIASNVISTGNSKSMRLEYELFKVNSRFKDQFEVNDQFPLQLINHVDTLSGCKSLCAQIDCRSFSYCPLEDTCQLSSLHLDSELNSQSQSADLCAIHRREYLSKFYPAGPMPQPGDDFDRPSEVETNKDCAARCMEASSLDCRAFALCPNRDQSTFSCYLSDSREINPEVANTSSNKTQCQFYQRSYVADFVKFYGKSLPDSTTDVSVIVLNGLTVEDCAARCVASGGSCEAFHVCRSSAQRGAPLCALSRHSVESKLQSSRMLTSQLIDSSECTAFIMTTEQLRKTIENSIGDLNELLTSMSGNDATKRKIHRRFGGGSSFWSSLLFVTMGIASGYVITMLIQRRRGLT